MLVHSGPKSVLLKISEVSRSPACEHIWVVGVLDWYFCWNFSVEKINKHEIINKYQKVHYRCHCCGRAAQSASEDSQGKPCPAEMATLFLGMNEPDIQGSCMGNMFGTCVRRAGMSIAMRLIRQLMDSIGRHQQRETRMNNRCK